MRMWIRACAIVVIAFASVAAQQGPDHSNDGPLAGTGTRCYKGDDQAHMKHCDCELVCYGDTAREQPWDEEHHTGCLNYCAPQVHPPACACHVDEACAEPHIEEPQR